MIIILRKGDILTFLKSLYITIMDIIVSQKVKNTEKNPLLIQQ